jgi:glycerol transport system ATP-binding protein
MGDLVIKSKVEREKPIPDGELNLYFPPEKCCVYSDEKLV